MSKFQRDFKGNELKKLGLPLACNGGKVHEDRLLERSDNDENDETDELRFVIFELNGEMWGVPYMKRESGDIVFDKTVHASRYELRQMIVPVDCDESPKKRAA